MEMYILDAALCMIECSAVFIFFNSLLTKRFRTFVPLVAAIFICGVIVFVCSGFSAAIKTIVYLVLLISGSSILYKDNILIKASYSALLLFISSIIDVIFGTLFSVVFNESFLDIFYSTFAYRTIVCLIIKTFEIAVMMLMYKGFAKIGENLKKTYWCLFGIVISVCLLVTTVFMSIYPQYNHPPGMAALYLIVSIAFFGMSIIITYFFMEICAGFQRDRKLYILESGYNILQEKVAVQNQSSEKLKKIRHDIKNHLLNISALLENGKAENAKELIKEIVGDIENTAMDIEVSTGNNIVDAVVSIKFAVCASKNIVLKTHIESLKSAKIDSKDISSLLSNLLDNAIESAEKAEEKYIDLVIYKYNAYYVIRIENGYGGCDAISCDGQRLISTKNNGFLHGYGTQIVEEIARKYNGESVWNADDKRFTVKVLLKI